MIVIFDELSAKAIKSGFYIWTRMLFTIGLLFSMEAQSSEQSFVLQINASLIINQEVEFEAAPFILLEGEPSTLAEEGLGGYKVELIAKNNQDNSYTVYCRIYNYTKSGYRLLGESSIKMAFQSKSNIEFNSESAGPVFLQLEIVEKALIDQDTSDFGQAVR